MFTKSLHKWGQRNRSRLLQSQSLLGYKNVEEPEFAKCTFTSINPARSGLKRCRITRNPGLLGFTYFVWWYVGSALSRYVAPIATVLNIIRESSSFIYYSIRLKCKAPALSVGFLFTSIAINTVFVSLIMIFINVIRRTWENASPIYYYK